MTTKRARVGGEEIIYLEQELFRQPTICHALLRHLAPIDYWCAYRAFPTLFRKMQKFKPADLLRQAIQKELDYALGPLDAAVVLGLIDSGVANVSGGFLVDVLHGNGRRHYTDIDLFAVRDRPFPDLVQLFPIDRYCLRPSEVTHSLYGSLADKDQMRIMDVYPRTGREGYWNHVQYVSFITLTTTQNNMQAHVDRFDFAVCRNVFSLGRLYMQDPAAVVHNDCGQIHLTKQWFDLKRDPDFDPYYLWHAFRHRRGRLEKYMKRRGCRATFTAYTQLEHVSYFPTGYAVTRRRIIFEDGKFCRAGEEFVDGNSLISKQQHQLYRTWLAYWEDYFKDWTTIDWIHGNL